VEPQYFANLTGEPYLYFELKQVAKLTLAGLSPVEIRAKIKDENLFQSATNKSIDKLLSATLKRVAVLDEIMLNILVDGSLHSNTCGLNSHHENESAVFGVYGRSVSGKSTARGTRTRV